MTTELAVAPGVIDVWAQPRRGPDDDRVTQALLNTPARVEETAGDWVRVRLPDYTGWVERAHLAAPAAPAQRVLAVTSLAAPLWRAETGDSRIGTAYLGTVLPLLRQLDRDCQVALPGGEAAWIERDSGWIAPAERPYARRSGDYAVAVARRFLGAPYLWGGGTIDGIDCSALVQLAYRLCGVTLPRDADQQWAALDRAVERGALAPGDLLFFARNGAVVHVALSLGGEDLLHALGEPARGVCSESLKPGDARYNARLAALYLGARRVAG